MAKQVPKVESQIGLRGEIGNLACNAVFRVHTRAHQQVSLLHILTQLCTALATILRALLANVLLIQQTDRIFGFFAIWQKMCHVIVDVQVNEKTKLVSLISYLIHIFLFEISSPHAISSQERLTAAETKNEWCIDTNLQVIMIMKTIRTFRNASISYKD